MPLKNYEPKLLNDLEKILSEFEPVSLNDINEVKLMSRIDRKYWFHISKLNDLLTLALPYYNILEINGKRLMDYETEYFDTDKNDMYFLHHRSELPRLKIRLRKYLETSTSFLEIKRKTNKQLTVKSRIEFDINSKNFNSHEDEFLVKNTPFSGKTLHTSLNNRFKRITLINKDKNDRCTIDISPFFWNGKDSVVLENLVIFELKKGQSLHTSQMVTIARKLQIRQRGFSKYCTGKALLEPELKQNAFKPKLRFLKQHIIKQKP